MTPGRADGPYLRAYKPFSKRRTVAEHTIARLKHWQILRQCRRRGNGIDLAALGGAVCTTSRSSSCNYGAALTRRFKWC
ncbi:hypothetical protein JCM4914_74070 [Streptomyces platensis subsp. malvinus]